MRNTILIFVLLFTTNYSISQVDSLKKVWENEGNIDTVRLEALKNYIWVGYMFTNPDSALILSKDFYDFAEKNGRTKYMGGALNHQAVALSIMGDSEGSMALFKEALAIYLEHGHEQIAASTYSNIGTILKSQGDYKSAAENFFKSLELAEKYDNKANQSAILNNLGVLYNDQKMYELSMKYHQESLALKLELKNEADIGMSYFNIGGLNAEMGDTAEAILNLEKAYEYFKKSDYTAGLGNYYINMGHLYNAKLNYDKSLELYNKGLETFKAINDIRNITVAEMHIGINYWQLGNNDKALKYLLPAYERALELEITSTSGEAAKHLYRVYSDAKAYDKALHYYEIYNTINDSLNSAEKMEATVHLKFQYEYDKKAIIDSINYAKGQELNVLEIKEQKSALSKAKTQRFALFGGIGLLLLFGLFVLRSYRRKKRDHDIISDQHNLLSQSHKEIRQSIDYAKKLQDAILPSNESLNKFFDNYFVLFKPKDTVSGDFYWLEYDAKSQTRLIAVADCTGHGVPGAMVSLVCATALNRCVNELGLIEPAEILNKTRELIIATFSKQQQHLRDGMDITICAISADNTCTVAGANNALWLVKKQDQNEIIEYRTNKQPVSWSERLDPFSQEAIPLQKGDILYLQSDGFIDQFGGADNKKYKRAALKKLILSIVSKGMKEQQQLLDEEFENWRGDFEQIDDVCIMGVEI